MRYSLEAVEDAPDLDAVRGHEGAAAAAYFGVLGEHIRAEGITFRTRIRRPPPDPTNILLSFGYTLLTRLMQGALEIAGLDPYLGALHAPLDNRPSLALDLIEELRPVLVDTTVLSVLNRRIIRADDFAAASDPEREPDEPGPAPEGRETPAARPLILSPEAAKRWFMAYERRLLETAEYGSPPRRLTYRQIVQEQAYRLARHVRGDEPYQPFQAPI